MTPSRRIALVTGGAGFIGSHLVEALLAAGWSVRCLIRYSSGGQIGHLADLPAEARGRLDLHRGDLLDNEFVGRLCLGADTIFHLAARISIPYSYEAPRDTVSVNTVGTLNLLEGARQQRVRRFVHASTSEVFGSAVVVPMDENHRLRAQSVYAASKIAADKLVEAYAASFGLQTVTVRPFNTYGPRQSPRAVIPAIISQALAGGPIRIGSLWPQRDFTFVTDTVAGFVLAADSERAAGEQINLGTGDAISIGDLAAQVMGIIGGALAIEEDAQRLRPAASEIDRLQSDNAKAREILGWAPQVPLDEGLRRTIEWWRRHPDTAWTGYAR